MIDRPANAATLPGLEDTGEPIVFTPTRDAGLSRLENFTPRMGKFYASRRNYDFGPDRRHNVSALSPWVRHRLITEEEILRSALSRHALSSAEKFVQEVFWRGYFKGWLEHRPSVWQTYRSSVRKSLEDLEADVERARDYADAVGGRTGIVCFDHWARELVETGYLHNHTRMWFASIWIFTLRLPWELGADFFLRHLVDGDAASNTLSWRWVAGLHTKGKTYLARASNIAKYTGDRFDPDHQLANVAQPLTESVEHACCPLPAAGAFPEEAYLMLVTEEDGHAEQTLPHSPAGVLGLLATEARSSLPIGAPARAFAQGAVTDAVVRMGGKETTESSDWAGRILTAAEAAKVRTVVTAYAPVGPVAERLAAIGPTLEKEGVRLHQVRRAYDTLVWRHATKGFFALKQKIPRMLQSLGLLV